MVSLNGGYFGYFKSADGFGGGQRRETRFLGLLGKEGNINFSATTAPKMHQPVWNSSLGTGLGDGGVELQLYWGISSQNTVSVVGSDAKPVFGIVGEPGKY